MSLVTEGLMGSPWDEVAEYTKAAQGTGCDPAVWTVHVSSTLAAHVVPLPSPELAQLLVSHLCWGNNVPLAWKYVERALAANIAPPMLLLALLSVRIIPSRCSKPVAYRLIMASINDVLHLSEKFGIQASEPGVLVVEYVFSILWQLLDATLDDEGIIPSRCSKPVAYRLYLELIQRHAFIFTSQIKGPSFKKLDKVFIFPP
ncbi:hypothetical protein C4D60_Mb06t31290 [Musa balbisiana]|uniref:Uncharacterized protein n=1 Tax=Musa balbisiana TaxID=52838 RepID=A0A4S8IS56_MUSBA|nr:hypothetical protein C4D60_Mb06t31290 [Musa balbisiana]